MVASRMLQSPDWDRQADEQRGVIFTAYLPASMPIYLLTIARGRTMPLKNAPGLYMAFLRAVHYQVHATSHPQPAWSPDTHD